MPLVTVHCPTDHEPFEVRVDDRVYTVSENAVVTLYVEPEALANFTTQVQTAIPSSTVTARPE